MLALQYTPDGRAPDIIPELAEFALDLAVAPAWGYGKLEGELGKLGYDISRSTIKAVLKRKWIPPAPLRGTHGSS